MKKLPWYQNLQIIAWSAGGLTAAGALIVGMARYLNLPKEVEAAQQKNVLQDEAIIELKKSNEIWQSIYQQQQTYQQQQAPKMPGPYQSPAGLEEWENGVCWRCPYLDRQRCFDQDLWQICP